MAQHPVEVILTRELAAHLAQPVFLVDDTGRLVYYNEAAERIVGAPFAEVGEMSVEEWWGAFAPRDDRGRLVGPASLPLVVALREQRAVTGRGSITGFDGVTRFVRVTAIPLSAESGQCRGAFSLFWERS
jgi:PAS domain-containing protein